MLRSANAFVALQPAERIERWPGDVPTFEEQLARDSRWALSEGSKFFEGAGAVQETLRKITTRLQDLEVSFATVGGMALFYHGLRRFTEDIDLLVTREGLRKIHEHLDGLGYLPPFTGSKNLRDTDTGVRIEFLIAGEFPGDGLPKPVAFPDPSTISVEIGGMICAALPTLIELKLASGMTGIGRLKDLADVQELIKRLDLPRAFGNQLNPFVQPKFDELWTSTQPTKE
jgi:hypothetical protein